MDFELTGAGYDPQGAFRGVSWNAVLEGGGALVSQKVTLEFDVVAVWHS